MSAVDLPAPETNPRESSEQLRFLLQLSDALRSLADASAGASEIQRAAMRLVGEHLRVDCTLYGDVRAETPGDEIIRIDDCYVRGDMRKVTGEFRLSAFGAAMSVLRAGNVLVIEDQATTPLKAPSERAASIDLGVRASASVPIIREGRWVATFGVLHGRPRRFTEQDVAILREVAERTWVAVERARALAALHASEERFRSVSESGVAAIAFFDETGAITDANDAFLTLVGYSRAELAAGEVRWDRLTPPEWMDRTRQSVDAFQQTGQIEPYEKEYFRKDGTRFWGLFSGRRLDTTREAVAVVIDITERKRADAALRESEARYRTLVENVRGYAIFLLDANGTITDWTTGAERVMGYSATEVVGLGFTKLYSEEAIAAGEPRRELAEAAANGRVEREGWRVRKGGEPVWVNEITTAVRDIDGRLVGFTKINRDLTGQRAAADAIELTRVATARDDLRRALAAAEEAERRRLARELHDQLGQHLTGFMLGLADVRRRTTTGEPVDERLDQLEELARLMTRDARSLALELRPPELDDVGLESALETYVRDWGHRHGIMTDVAIVGRLAGSVPPDVGSALYRITQEALTNVARHAGATQVSVILEYRDVDAVGAAGHSLDVRLLVEDDGRGFDVENTAARARIDQRLGLAGMHERAALVGGMVVVESSPGAGTALQVRIPIAGRRADCL